MNYLSFKYLSTAHLIIPTAQIIISLKEQRNKRQLLQTLTSVKTSHYFTIVVAAIFQRKLINKIAAIQFTL